MAAEYPCGHCRACSTTEYRGLRFVAADHSPFPSSLSTAPTPALDQVLFQYSPASVANGFIRILNRPRDYDVDMDFIHRQWLDKDDLAEIFRAFDQYLFQGALLPYVRVEWAPVTDPEVEWVGISMWDPQRFNGILINIVREPPHVGWAEKVVAILLHEMCHAVFQIYACNCHVCQCVRNNARGHGLTGHGPAWLHLALAVDEKVKEDLENLEVHGIADGNHREVETVQQAQNNGDYWLFR